MKKGFDKLSKREQYLRRIFSEDEIEDLRAVLEEYLQVFKNHKEHKNYYGKNKKEKCPNCEIAKKILKKLK